MLLSGRASPQPQPMMMICMATVAATQLFVATPRSKVVLAHAQPMNGPLHRSSLLVLQLIMDTSSRQKLWLHTPKLLLWVLFEACTIATTVLRVGCSSGAWEGAACMQPRMWLHSSRWECCLRHVQDAADRAHCKML